MITHTPAYYRDWKLRVRLRHNPRPSTAKYRCIDCSVEVCKCALRCASCGSRNRTRSKGANETVASDRPVADLHRDLGAGASGDRAPVTERATGNAGGARGSAEAPRGGAR